MSMNIFFLVGECTALWASQQHAHLPEVVQNPAKLMHGGKRYSFACVNDTVSVYMYIQYVKLE